MLVRPVPVAGEPDGPTPGQARGPTWRRTTPGLYVPSDTPDSVEQRIVEQSMRLPEGGAVGGWASLRLHGAAYFDGESHGAQLPVPLVTPYDAARQRQLPGTRVERTRRPIHVVVLHGIPCVAAAWAVVAEAAHAPGMLEAVTVIDMALAAGVVARAEIDGVLAQLHGARGVDRVRRALVSADERSRSPHESWMRFVWVHYARLPRPRCNWLVVDETGRVIGSPDLLSPELGLVGEFEGATHLRASQRRGDVRRQEAFEAVGLQVVTVVGRHRDDEAELVARLLTAAERARASTTPQTWWAREYPLP